LYETIIENAIVAKSIRMKVVREPMANNLFFIILKELVMK